MSNTSTIKRFTVSVRALAEFNMIEGDLISAYRPTPSAFEGQQTHKLIQQKRDRTYQSEVSLKTTWVGSRFDLLISGRADGVYLNGIEEIKTTRIPPDEIPQVAKQHHMTQAKIYAAMYLLAADMLPNIEITITYAHPQTLQEWSTQETFAREQIIDEFITLCLRYDAWLNKLSAHHAARAQFLDDLAFPFSVMRKGQRQMAEDVYKACRTGKHLTVEAPTGTGKTLASIFPALKSMTQADIQSLFFLTMKTTGKVAAKDAIENLDPNKELATVFLSAKHRLCLNEDTVCDGEFCPYAKDYFSKRQAIREQLFSRQHWHDDALKKLGTDHQICPYYLSQDWAVWADIIVGDINYIYDTTAVQPYLLKEINNRATVLIDESHNLIDRGRMIYSAEFDGNSIQQLLKETPKAIQKKLRKIQSKMRKVCQEHDAQLSTHLPNSFCQALKDFIAQSPVLLRESPQYTPTDDWQNFIFSCARFSRLNELANTVDFRWRYHDGKPHERRIELLCLSPSKLLEDKHNLVNNVVAFSATLKPWKYSNQLNGLPTAVISELPSPFQPQQYQVYIANDVSTRYRDRVDLPKQLINTLEKVTKSDKNSMVFFSSYQQLNNCTKALPESDTTLIQQSDWTNEMRDKVLAQFKNERGITLMTVLGGVFSEGIDLPGSQLETVVIVGPGLPQVNDVNNAIKDRMNQQQFPGFDFAYVFPGIQKVLQAAGRCVRSEQDNGHILLIDDRFLEYQRQQWLPSFWEIKSGPLNLWNCVS